MDLILILLGAALVLLAYVDLLWTVVASSSGAGPITGRLGRAVWGLVLRLHYRLGGHSLLLPAGTFIVVGVLLTWIVLIVAGWYLVLLAGDPSVVLTATGEAAGALDRLYFAGYTIFTLGNGEFRPPPGAWQIATVLMAGSGLVLVSLSITFLVPLAGAGAQARSVASYIDALGQTPEEIVVRGWNGGNFSGLASHLVNLTPLIQRVSEAHLTYPILHYLQSGDPRSAMAPAIARLQLALDLLDHGVAPSHRLPEQVTNPCRTAVRWFLETVAHSHQAKEAREVPSPRLEALEQAGVPVVTESEYRRALGESAPTRELLGGLLHGSGWHTEIEWLDD